MKLIVILDIDNTLIDAEFDDSYRIKNVKPDFKFKIDNDVFNIWKRTGLDEFLEWLFNNHEVAFWSASHKEYVDEVLRNILKHNMKPLFIWSSNKCTKKIKYEGWTTDSIYIIKDLNKFWKKKSNREELKRKTIIVDDTPTTYLRNYGNALPIGHFMKDPKDIELSRIKEALTILSEYSNVR